MSIGTLTYNGTEWEVVSFVGNANNTTLTVGPITDPAPNWVVAKWLTCQGDGDDMTPADCIDDADDLLFWLSDQGFAIVATQMEES